MTARKRHALKNRMVEYEIDLVHPPALTAAQKAEFAALQAKPESAIDYSDIPPLNEAFGKDAVRNPFRR